jgi:hypothetical protein
LHVCKERSQAGKVIYMGVTYKIAVRYKE